MNRLEKKCFVTAASAHGLLFVILFVGPAFFTPANRTMPSTEITVFDPATISMTENSQGGNPASAPANPSPPTPTPVQPQVTTQKPPEIPPPPKDSPKPVKVKDFEKDPPKMKVDHGEDPVPVKKKHVSQIDDSEFVPTKVDKTAALRKAREDAQKKAAARAAAAAREQAEQANAVNSALRSIKNNTSGSTQINYDPGVGGGGRATINYFQLIQSTFDAAWHPSETLGDGTPTATISVIISRNGTVRGRISKHSGNSLMDRSVQNVLDTVTSVEPFPDSFKEQQVTATFNFDIKARR